MACYPWIVNYSKQQQDIDNFPNLKRWRTLMEVRPAIIRAYEVASTISTEAVVSEESKKILFGQDADTIQIRK